MDAFDRLFSLQSFPTLSVGYFLWCPLVVFSKVFSFDNKFPSSKRLTTFGRTLGRHLRVSGSCLPSEGSCLPSEMPSSGNADLDRSDSDRALVARLLITIQK